MPEFSLQSPEFRANPYPILNALRESAAVLPLTEGIPYWFGRYDDCDAALRDNAHFGRDAMRVMTPEEIALIPPPPPMFQPLVAVQSQMLLFRDPPVHTRLRSLINRAFTPRMIQSLKASIEDIADSLLKKVVSQGGMDVVADFALPLPVTVIARMLGIPEDDYLQFRAWSEHLLGANDIFGPPPERLPLIIQANMAVAEYVRRLIAVKRTQPDENLLSALIKIEEAGDHLSEDELVATAIVILVAGFETTTNLISNMVLQLLRHPEQWQAVKASPELATGAVRETLRYEPPVFVTARSVLADTEMHGVRLTRLMQVAFMLASANRDPRKYTAPDVFDITRNEAAPLTFGAGIHYCLGAPLAMLEGEVALRALIRHMPEMRLVSDQVVWRDILVLRALEALPVSFG